jgi:hypothetical protein
MRTHGLSFLVLALALEGTQSLIAQTPDIQEKIAEDLAFKRLNGFWVPELLLTTEGAEAYPLKGRLLWLDRGTFARMEGKRTVASGSYKVEQGYLRLTVEDRSAWDLEAGEIKDKLQYAFKIDGDLLTLCYSVGNKGKAGDLTPGEGRTVVVYKRQRADGRGQEAPAKR